MNRWNPGVLPRLCVPLLVGVLGLGLAAMTLRADPPRKPDAKKPAEEPGGAKQGRLVKPIVFKVEGIPDPLAVEKVNEFLTRNSRAKPQAKSAAKASIKLAAYQPGPLSKEEKLLIVKQAEPILKNLGLASINVSELLFSGKHNTISPKYPFFSESGRSYGISLLHPNMVDCAPGNLAYFTPLEEIERYAPRAVDVVLQSNNPGYYVVVIHLVCESESADFTFTSVYSSSRKHTVHLDKGLHAIPVILNLSGRGYFDVLFQCDNARWSLYSCDIWR